MPSENGSAAARRDASNAGTGIPWHSGKRFVAWGRAGIFGPPSITQGTSFFHTSTKPENQLHMNRNSTPALLAGLLLAGTAAAQLATRPDGYYASGVTNTGLVAGYTGADGYLLWNPDEGTTEDIGGVTPGDGAGGQAKFSLDGQRLSGGATATDGQEIAGYDRNAGAWTTYGSLGTSLDGSASSGWAISADGQTVVGLAWAGGFAAHAVAHSAAEGLMDLGSLVADRSTRANAVSGDGGIVVGWQDSDGPWKSAVWRKNPAGGYFPNEYLLIDPNGSATDDNNQLGECNAISADGHWIGGHGDYANNDEPWIWSEGTGAINLGTMPGMGRGYVAAMSANGAIVVGWFDGMFFGDPRKAFMWTATDGIQDLNEYATTVLGVTLGTKGLYTAGDISPNGRYICGWGLDSGDFSRFGFRLDMGTQTGIAASRAEAIAVYPNPATDIIRFNSPEKAELTLSGADGKVVYRAQVAGEVGTDISGLAAGVYLLELRTANGVRTQRIAKN